MGSVKIRALWLICNQRLPYPWCQFEDTLCRVLTHTLEVKENDDEHWMRKVWLDTVEGQPTLDI